MREIKLRFGDKEEKYRSQPFTLTDLVYERGITVYSKEHKQEFYISELDQLQYTGLKDKNGKDIYEGDIVKGIINEKQDIWVIDMSNLYWHQSPKGFSFDNSWIRFRVIGNIYENPELVEK